MTWRVAKALDRLLAEVDAAGPNRSKASDGSIGDPAHSSRVSDHNPNPYGVVCARDFTHDPAQGADMARLAEYLRARRDRRIKYVIFNHRIMAGNGGPSPWEWRDYTGDNPHEHHLHLSVESSSALYDDAKRWGWMRPPTLRRGSVRPNWIKVLRCELAEAGIRSRYTGKFRWLLERKVKKFQARNGLKADGIVGPRTWHALGIRH